jgi:hypothetical protein
MRGMKILSTLVAVIFIASTVFAAPITVNRFSMLAQGLDLNDQQKAAFQEEFIKEIKAESKDNFIGVINSMYKDAKQVGSVDQIRAGVYYNAILTLLKGATVEDAVSKLFDENKFTQTQPDTGKSLVAFLQGASAGVLLGDLPVGEENFKYYQATDSISAEQKDAVAAALSEIYKEIPEVEAILSPATIAGFLKNLVNGGYFAKDNAYLIPMVIVELLSGTQESSLINQALKADPKIGAIKTGFNGQTIAEIAGNPSVFGKWLLSALSVHEYVERTDPRVRNADGTIDHDKVVEIAESGKYAQYAGFFAFMQQLYDFELATEIGVSQSNNIDRETAGAVKMDEKILVTAKEKKTPIYVTKEALPFMQDTFALAFLTEMQNQGYTVILPKDVGYSTVETVQGAVIFAATNEKYDNNVVMTLDNKFAGNEFAQFYFKSILMKLLEKAQSAQFNTFDINNFAGIFDFKTPGVIEALTKLISPAAKHMLTARAMEVAA